MMSVNANSVVSYASVMYLFKFNKISVGVEFRDIDWLTRPMTLFQGWR